MVTRLQTRYAELQAAGRLPLYGDGLVIVDANLAKNLLVKLSTPTIAAAAAMAGVSECTLYNWLNQADFQEAYREARRMAISHALGNLAHFSAHAVGVLVELMLDEKVPPGVRASAAGKVLELSIDSVDQENVLARIEALEERNAQAEP
ncbi:MAG TPA: hypothetical protein VKE41_21145 [Roseiflexaceae bacterium]|nr:hypothetical protein [Roseiflexaceae bacterium]